MHAASAGHRVSHVPLTSGSTLGGQRWQPVVIHRRKVANVSAVGAVWYKRAELSVSQSILVDSQADFAYKHRTALPASLKSPELARLVGTSHLNTENDAPALAPTRTGNAALVAYPSGSGGLAGWNGRHRKPVCTLTLTSHARRERSVCFVQRDHAVLVGPVSGARDTLPGLPAPVASERPAVSHGRLLPLELT